MLHRISSQLQISNLSKCRYSLEEHYASSLFCHVFPFSGSCMVWLLSLLPDDRFAMIGVVDTVLTRLRKAKRQIQTSCRTTPAAPSHSGYNGSRSNKTEILTSQFIQHSKGLQDTQIRFQETLRDSGGVPFLVSRIWSFFHFERALPLLTGEHYSWHEATLFLL